MYALEKQSTVVRVDVMEIVCLRGINDERVSCRDLATSPNLGDGTW